MAGLPNNTFAAPGVPFYASAGGGAASTLQSPVAVLPAVDGSVAVVAQGTLNGNATVSAITNPAGSGNAAILVGASGTVYSLAVGGSGIPNPQGSLAIGVNGAPEPAFLYNGVTGNIEIGDSSGGTIRMNNAVAVFDTEIDPTQACGVYIGPTSATTTVIENTKASSGTLSIGSSVVTNQLVLSDTGAGTAQVVVAGNGGTNNIKLQGGSLALDVPIINSTAATNGTVCLGGSASNPQTVFVTSGGAADSGYVDITGGTSTGTAVRIRGYGTGTSATVSTNNVAGVLNVSSGPADVSPAIVISPTALTLNRNQTVFAAPTVGSGAYGITQQIINDGNNIGTTSYSLTNPTLAGVYNILVRVGTAAAININGQISTVGYWDGTVWVAGGVNISPPLGTGNLNIWFGSTATTRTTLLLQNTGSAELSGVAVYMIPQLIGLSSVIT